jgi:acetylornithine deacetylase/succinyl-diaminopimelate desuccinylase-like protein
MDDKGGIVAGIYALKILKNLDFKDYAQITFLLDASEETGSDVATDLIKKTAKAHDVTLNLEPGRPADGLVVWRKGSATALVEVKGKAAHAARGAGTQRGDGSGAPDSATGQTRRRSEENHDQLHRAPGR